MNVVNGLSVQTGAPGEPRAPAPKCVYLSPPHLGDEELELVRDAFASGWIAPLGPHVDAFERDPDSADLIHQNAMKGIQTLARNIKHRKISG